MFLEYLEEAIKVFSSNFSNLFSNFGEMVKISLEENLRLKTEIQMQKAKPHEYKISSFQQSKKRNHMAATAKLKESAYNDR
jgi:hypothetical protein